MRALALQTDDRGRECVRSKREILDAPPERKQDEADVAKQRRRPRQHMPAEHVEPSDDGKS
jgi:hypothetical protein